jgi:hypothetical protein
MIFAAMVATSRARRVVAGFAQPGDVAELRVLQPPGLGLLVHHRDEHVERAAHRFGQHHRGVVAALHDHALEQVVDTRRHRRVDEHERAATLALGPGALRHRQRLFQRQLLVADGGEHQVGGHQLGQRGRVGLHVGLALGQHLLAVQVEQDVAARSDLRRLRRLGQRTQGRGRGHAEGKESFHRYSEASKTAGFPSAAARRPPGT